MKKSIVYCLICLFITITAHAEITYTTKGGGYIASVSERYFDIAVKYISQGDKQAFANMVKKQKVFILREGLEVYLEKAPFMSGKVLVRKKGTDTRVWTIFKALEQN